MKYFFEFYKFKKKMLPLFTAKINKRLKILKTV